MGQQLLSQLSLSNLAKKKQQNDSEGYDYLRHIISSEIISV